jgi:hypothetical protein
MTTAPLALLHHLARSGGTIITKSVAVASNAALLSEVHPFIGHWFNPLAQARTWHGLVEAHEVPRNHHFTPAEYQGAIALIKERCDQRGRRLLLRDWSHADFTASIPTLFPTMRSANAALLEGAHDLRRVCTTRHPVDQWLSYNHDDSLVITPATWLAGYHRFAIMATRVGFVRYEDFTTDPVHWTAHLCAALDLPFDPGFQDRLADYTTITNDPAGVRAGSAIATLPRRERADRVRDLFRENRDYLLATMLLGYDA